jgi:hypothetical protein
MDVLSFLNLISPTHESILPQSSANFKEIIFPVHLLKPQITGHKKNVCSCQPLTITSASKDHNSVVLELWIPAFAGMTDYSCI